MADLTEQLASQLAQTITRTNSAFMSTQTVIDNFNRARSRELLDYTTQLDKKGLLNKEETELIKDQIKTLKEMQKSKTEKFQQDKVLQAKDTAFRTKSINEAKNQLADLEKRRALQLTYDKQTDDDIKATRAAAIAHVNNQRAVNASLRKAQQELDLIAKQIKDTEDEMSVSKKVLGDSIRGAGTIIKEGLGKILNPAYFMQGIRDMGSSIQAEISTGINLPFKKYMETAQLGMKPEEFVNAMAQYRGAALAAGGLNETMGILTKAQGEYKNTIGKQEDITKSMLIQMDTFRKSGIKPLASDTTLLQNSFLSLRKMAGMTGPQFQEMMAEMQSDESTIAGLRATSNEAERRQMLTNIATRIQENVAMGMTIEQAKAATKTLNKLAGQGPIDRLKQAAKLRAFGGAMGISGAGEAAQALIAGQRATKEQKDQLQQFLSTSSNALTQSALGPMGGEIFSTQLADKLGLTQLIGPGSDFNTVLTKDLAVGMQNAANTLGEVPPMLKTANEWYQKLHNALMFNPWLMMIAGGVGYLALKGGISDKISTAVENALWKGKNGATLAEGVTAAETTAKEASTLSKAAGATIKTLGPIAKVAGPLAVVAGGAYEGYEEYQKTGNKEKAIGTGVGTAAGGWAGMAAGAEMGAMVGALGGPIGIALGGVIGGALGAWGGGSLGGWLGGKAGEEMSSAEVLSNSKAQAQELAKTPNKAEEATAETNTTMALDISEQVRQLTKSNDYLKQILESSENSNDLSGRMLAVLTMTDANRAKEAGKIVGGNKFSAPYAQMG